MLGRTLIYFSVTIFVYGITEIKVFTVDTSRNTRIIRYLAKHSYTWNESGLQCTKPLVQKMKVRLSVSTSLSTPTRVKPYLHRSKPTCASMLYLNAEEKERKVYYQGMST